VDEPKFWAVVQRAHDASGGDMEKKCAALTAEIVKLTRDEALGFTRLFDSMMDRAYSWGLWGAAYVINGGCGDDTFSDFRASLISRGRAAFDHALSDPDSLAGEDLGEDEWFFEGYQYAVAEAVESVTGSRPPRVQPHPAAPSGTEWDEAKVYDSYPRLRDKYA
jgi:hypothetical protein